MKKRHSKNHFRPKEHREFAINDSVIEHLKNKYRKQHIFNYYFNLFAKHTSDIVGNAWTFTIALSIVLIWGLAGNYYHYSDTWQLIINTSTTIITFLVVFLIQNTQNRDTEIINLKIDELIRSKKNATNHIINLAELSDIELKELEKEYIRLCNKRTGK